MLLGITALINESANVRSIVPILVDGGRVPLRRRLTRKQAFYGSNNSLILRVICLDILPIYHFIRREIDNIIAIKIRCIFLARGYGRTGSRK